VEVIDDGAGAGAGVVFACVDLLQNVQNFIP